MKNKCFFLVRAQLFNQFQIKEKTKKQFIMMIGLGLLAIMLVIYSYSLGYGLVIMDMAVIIPSYAIAITSMITLFFTAIKTNGVLFAYQDYDMLMALPVKTSTLIASRFLCMYIMNLVFTILIMFPMGIAYAIFMKPSIIFYFIWIIGTIAAPLIPTTIATMLGACIIFFSSHFKYANAAATIFTFAVIIGLLFLSMSTVNLNADNIIQIKEIGEMLFSQLHHIYPIAILFYQAVVELNLLSFLIYLILSLGWFYLFVKLVSLKYKRINTELMTYHTSSNYHLTKLKANTPFFTLYKKELKRFFSCTIYVLNMGLGAVLAIIMTAVIAITGPEQLSLILNLPAQLITNYLPLILAFLMCTCCTTCVALSLEGKNLWIIQSVPLDTFTILKSKIAVNLTIQLPISLICSILLASCISLSLLMTVMLFLTPIVYSFLTSFGGMFINIKLPSYEWTSETIVVKQSASAMVGILGGMLNGLISISILFFFNTFPAEFIIIALTILEAIGALLFYYHLKKATLITR